MTMDWPTAAVASGVLGGVVLIVRDLVRKPKPEATPENPVISALVSSLQQDGHERRDFMRQLVNVQSEVALALKEQSISNKYATTRTEELHKQTHSKLEEITGNQVGVLNKMDQFIQTWNRAA